MSCRCARTSADQRVFGSLLHAGVCLGRPCWRVCADQRVVGSLLHAGVFCRSPCCSRGPVCVHMASMNVRVRFPLGDSGDRSACA
jgi:hypothetical protein